ncbi:hypothetical protein ATANTOWER_001806, partial [Ataeniobius toweri]|nr:hypothetical protein [Ataeniobius toweri]
GKDVKAGFLTKGHLPSNGVQSGLDVVTHTWGGSSDVCRHLRHTEKNKSAKNRMSPFPPVTMAFCSLTICLHFAHTLLQTGFNVSCDFLPVVSTQGSLCLRVSLQPPPQT